MEILSPAGNLESLIAAVRSGADAVYLGLKDFSARRNADNFSLEELREAVDYCHIRGVKVYLTLNIMLKSAELPEALKAAADAYNCGVDAFIVSDLGLLSVLKSQLPEIELHASTQMTVHSPAALKPLKKLGIKRVVLGREMSREEIGEFCLAAKELDIEVEVFVHGALCMCVSGKCLMSSVLGGRSGNRGYCAGPCRLEFSATGHGRHDLSLKDLSLIDFLGELEKTGVDSVKIEGRMKRPEYVAAATAACRSALDGKPDSELNVALKNVFSRSGFTDGYYNGNLGADMFGIRTKDDAEISKTAFSYLHSLYRNDRQNIPLKIYAKIKTNQNIEIMFCDNSNNKVTVYGEKPQIAKNRCITEDDIKASLSKLGGTPYFLKQLSVNTDDGLFVSPAELNSLRREAVEKLDKLRRQNKRSASIDYTLPQIKETIKNKFQIYAQFLNSDMVPDGMPAVDGIILPFDDDFGKIPDSVLKIAALPRYITNEKKVKTRLSELKEKNVNTAYCDNLSAITLANDAGFKVLTSNGFNCANPESLKAIKALGADMAVLSAEVSIKDKYLSSADIPTGIFAFGRLPLMLTRNCPVKNAKTCKECKKQSSITDRQGIKFPVRCRDGYSEIFNSTPVYLADKRDDLSRFDFLLLNFTTEKPDEINNIIRNYRNGGKTPESFTRGLYYKNLP